MSSTTNTNKKGFFDMQSINLFGNRNSKPESTVNVLGKSSNKNAPTGNTQQGNPTNQTIIDDIAKYNGPSNDGTILPETYEVFAKQYGQPGERNIVVKVKEITDGAGNIKLDFDGFVPSDNVYDNLKAAVVPTGDNEITSTSRDYTGSNINNISNNNEKAKNNIDSTITPDDSIPDDSIYNEILDNMPTEYVKNNVPNNKLWFEWKVDVDNTLTQNKVVNKSLFIDKLITKIQKINKDIEYKNSVINLLNGLKPLQGGSLLPFKNQKSVRRRGGMKKSMRRLPRRGKLNKTRKNHRTRKTMLYSSYMM